MNREPATTNTRREFLTGRGLRSRIEEAGNRLADEIVGDSRPAEVPVAGSTVRLAARAMACEFSVVMNPGPPEQVMVASSALDGLDVLEQQMSAYRPDSELSKINRRAHAEPATVEPQLFELLLLAREISRFTDGAFDPTSGPLIALWRDCRQAGRIPAQTELAACLERTGIEHVEFDEKLCTVRFHRPNMEFNLGAIGKGYALDRGGAVLKQQGLDNWLYHGGHSSILAAGCHNGHDGWPVGIGNPLFTSERFGTLLLRDRAMSTSGSNIQFFRHDGRRYGHILDPRTGWPAEELLSVTVVAPTAAEADALSTAFFVLGVEKTLEYCDNRPQIGVLMVPQPRQGRRLAPTVHGIADDVLFLASE
jgi:thiamine biosynthesis lipoprotein